MNTSCQCACLGALLAVAGVTTAAADSRFADAVERHDTEAVRLLLRQHADVNAPQADGATALAWAVHYNDLDTTNLLIRAGANPNAANDLGVTPLWLACENGNTAIVERLLEARANPNAALTTGETLLMQAARTNSVGAITALLVHGVDVNGRKSGRGGQTALMWAAAMGHADAVQALIGGGADAHARSASGFMPLLFAARIGDIPTLRVLLRAGALVDDQAPDGTTALTMAVDSNHEDAAIAVLLAGADAKQTSAGYTPLHTAVQRGYAALVAALLGHGADPNVRLTKAPPLVFGTSAGAGRADLTGATPFLIAARGANIAMMRTLLTAGADPRLTTSDGTTPLMVAAGLGQLEDTTQKGFDALAAAARWQDAAAVDAVHMLLDLKTDINARNTLGNTALHGASYVGANAIVQLLVDKGARIDAQDAKGQTPFRIAEGHIGAGATFLQYPGTAELLRKLGANTTLGVEARLEQIRPLP